MSNHEAMLVVDADQAFRESMINLLPICEVKSFEIASNFSAIVKSFGSTTRRRYCKKHQVPLATKRIVIDISLRWT